jgi:hypothetical protein
MLCEILHACVCVHVCVCACVHVCVCVRERQRHTETERMAVFEGSVANGTMGCGGDGRP